MLYRRIQDLENRNVSRDMMVDRSLKRLEAIIEDQKAEIYRLEDLVSRTMHRNRVSRDVDSSSTSPRPGKGLALKLHMEDSHPKNRRRRLSVT